MKLLVITSNPAQYGISSFDYLLHEVAQLVDIKIWTEAGDIKEILRDINFKPDFILINEFGEGYTPIISGLGQLLIPWGIYLSDLNYQINLRKKEIAELNIRHIFSRYRDKFYEWYPQFYDRLLWLPQQFNPSIFKDYGLKKDIDYLFMGWVEEKKHPLRHKIIDALKDKPGFVSEVYQDCHNIWAEERHKMQQAPYYARQINRAKIFLTCDSVCRYPLATYYEVLACNCLLLAPWSREIEDLGFINGKHFIAINEYDNLAEKAEYYLHHDRERLAIARQGHDMVHSVHTTRIRATELVSLIYSRLPSVFNS